MEKNPIGFCPNDFDKILYLANKASGGGSSPSEDFIHIPTTNVYGKREPWEVFDELEQDEETHFFSNLKIKKKKMKKKKKRGILQTLHSHFFMRNLKIKWPKKKNSKKKNSKKMVLSEYLLPRSVGAGAWNICPGQTRVIFDSRGERIGFMSRYVYRSPPSHAHQDKRWVLEEYALSGRVKDCFKTPYDDGFRFCTLRKNQNLAIDVPDRMWPERVFDEFLIKAAAASRKRKRPDQDQGS